MNEPYYSFNRYLREKFGERVHRISIDAGFNCPNLDGTLSDKGCIYCNNKAFGVYVGAQKSIEAQINDSLIYYRKNLGVKKFIAYFQSFTNTYANTDELKKRYDVIKKFPEIIGLFISTRPDTIDEEKIDLISNYGKKYLLWIEYGLQSTNKAVLDKINRNHTYEDFLVAVKLTRKYNINVGAHIILGMPNMTYEEIMEDAKNLAGLDIQGVKFHILHALKNTPLEEIYQNGGITFLSKAQYIKMLCDFLERIPSKIVILRLISTASPGYLIAPLWINNKSEIKEAVIKELERRGTHQGYHLGQMSEVRCQRIY
jgi:radical SAM protein (TIGR01212 family)